MIKVEASKDEYGDYDAKEVVKIVSKGMDAGETEFSTPLSGYGNQDVITVRSSMRDNYNRDFNKNALRWVFDKGWEYNRRIEALRWVLIGLILGDEHPDTFTYNFVYDESTDVITFKVKKLKIKLIQLSKLEHGNYR